MKVFVRSVLSVALSMAAMNAMAMEVTDKFDFFGYARGGVFTGAEGSMEDSVGGSDFNKNKVGRFGNEFDNYAEVGFGADLYAEGDKSVYTQMMFNMWDGDTNSNASDNNFGWENMNIQFMNFLGMDENIWAGIRQYNSNEHYIDNIDYYYWNGTGFGAGIEGMQVGSGKMSIAVLHRDFDGHTLDRTSGEASEDVINAHNLEFMYYDLPVWDGGKMAFGYKFLNADANEDQQDAIDPPNDGNDYADGHALLLELNQELVNDGWNRTVLQYYVDGAALQGVTFGSADTLNGTVESGWGYALRNFGSIPLNAYWDLSHVINYAAAEDIVLQTGEEGDASTISLSAMLTYHWSDITRTYFEAGYFDDQKTVDGNDFDRSGSKLTLGQALSWGRGEPEIRVFASYFDSSSEDWDENQGFEMGQSDDTWAVGVQANLWW